MRMSFQSLHRTITLGLLFAVLANEVTNATTPNEQHTTKIGIRKAANGGQFLVNVILSERLKGTFLLDTGAESCFVSRDFCQQLNLSPKPYLDSKGKQPRLPINGNKPAETVTIPMVEFGEFKFEKIPCLVTDSERLPLILREQVDGVIGITILREIAFMLNSSKGEMTCWYPGNLTKEEVQAVGLQPEKPIGIRSLGRRIYTIVQLNDSLTEDFQIDIGTDLTCISQQAADKLQLKPIRKKIPRITSEGTMNLTFASLHSLGLGGVTINDLDVGVVAGKGTSTPVIGLDVLCKGNVLIDTPGGKMYMAQNRDGGK